METQIPPVDLSAPARRHLMHTLIALLPPPIEDTPEATLARNNAAAARIAALAPTNADQAELAAQCVAARAQAEDLMRLIRLHAADINLVVKLNAQCAAMFRASLAAHNRLLREQRRRREQPPTDKSERPAQTAAPAALRSPPVPKTETKSQPPKNETPGRRPEPDPRTIACINALIDAATSSARPGLPLPRVSRHDIPPQQQSAQRQTAV